MNGGFVSGGAQLIQHYTQMHYYSLFFANDSGGSDTATTATIIINTANTKPNDINGEIYVRPFMWVALYVLLSFCKCVRWLLSFSFPHDCSPTLCVSVLTCVIHSVHIEITIFSAVE